MTLEKKPFVSYTLDEDKVKGKYEVVSLKLNAEDRVRLNKVKKFLQQPKDSTTYKQCLYLQSISMSLLENKALIEVISGNIRKNKRSNIVDFE